MDFFIGVGGGGLKEEDWGDGDEGDGGGGGGGLWVVVVMSLLELLTVVVVLPGICLVAIVVSETDNQLNCLVFHFIHTHGVLLYCYLNSEISFLFTNDLIFTYLSQLDFTST